MYTVEVNMPNLAEGVEVEVDGLGVFENGGTYQLSDEEAQFFRQKHSHIETEYGEEGQMSNTLVLGPVLEEAFKDSETIKVTHTEDKAEKHVQDKLPVEGVNNNAS